MEKIASVSSGFDPEEKNKAEQSYYEDYLISGDLAFKALTAGLLDSHMINLYKQQHPEDIPRIEKFLNQEISAKDVQDVIDEKTHDITTKIKSIETVSKDQERQITNLGGNTEVIKNKISSELNVLSKIRGRFSDELVRLGTLLLMIGGFNFNKPGSENPFRVKKTSTSKPMRTRKDKDDNAWHY